MEIIVPNRSTISERFPIASFIVRVPPTRCFEVVCATDPRLLHTTYAGHRTPDNFYSSRNDGLLCAHAGEETFFIPPQQLRRFVGARRIYYALGSYAGRNGESPRFSISPDALQEVPSIGVGVDFTGRTLDRSRLGRSESPNAVYGGLQRAALRWGGDAVLDAERLASVTAAPASGDYDDGYDASLWKGAERLSDTYRDDPNDHDDHDDHEVARKDASADPPSSASAALTWSESAAEGGDTASDASAADEHESTSGPERAAAYEGGYLGYGGYGGYGGPDASDEDAAQDSPDSESFGVPDSEESEGSELDEAASVGEPSDSAAWDLGVDPEDAEDAAEYRAKQGGAEAPVGGDAASSTLADPDELDDDSTAYGRADRVAVLSEKDASYQEEDAPEDSLPVGPASVPLGAPALDIAEKVRILRIIGRADSGGEGYAAVSADTEYNDPRHAAYRLNHIGLSWGLLSFTQRSGAIGRVLSSVLKREAAGGATPAEHRFASLFGPDWQKLVRTTDPEQTPDPDARVEAVAGKLLWEEPWLGRFRAAGRVPHVQAAQNEVGVVHYFDRMLPIARWLGLDTARSLALLVDRAVHMGVGGGQAWVLNAIGPIRTEAERQTALRALGHDPQDLRAFQRTRHELVASGRWNAMTHAALVGALRALGERSPIALPARAQLEQAFVAAAHETPFEARVRALAESSAELDSTTAFDLA